MHRGLGALVVAAFIGVAAVAGFAFIMVVLLLGGLDKEEAAAGVCVVSSEGGTGSEGIPDQWKDEVEKEGLGKEAQVQRMKDLVAGNEALMANPFFQSVKAL